MDGAKPEMCVEEAFALASLPSSLSGASKGGAQSQQPVALHVIPSLPQAAPAKEEDTILETGPQPQSQEPPVDDGAALAADR